MLVQTASHPQDRIVGVSCGHVGPYTGEIGMAIKL